MLRLLVLSIICHMAQAVNEDCGTCLENNAAIFAGASSQKPAAWCYSTNQCMKLDGLTAWINLLGGACADYTFEANTCLCRPDIYDDCGKCATAQHLGCIWMANATVTNNVSYTILGAASSAATTYTWKKGRCVQGSGFSPFGLETVNEIKLPSIGFTLKLKNTVVPIQWYWARCSLTVGAMVGVLIGAVVAGTLLCCGCCYCFARRKRAARHLQVSGRGHLLPP